MWDLTLGTCVQEYYGHTAFVYAIDFDKNTGLLASCGEDRTVRIWKGNFTLYSFFYFFLLDGICIQTITHPCVSVWTVKWLQNGDIVSGGSDGYLRIFTRDWSRIASLAERQRYEEQLAQQAIPS